MKDVDRRRDLDDEPPNGNTKGQSLSPAARTTKS